MNKFTGLVRRCVEDYSMISAGDKICVGLSGGKDSVALLCALANLRTFYPQPYSLFAVTLDLGFGNVDFLPLVELCRSLEIPYKIVGTDIKQIVFDKRQEQNPCSLCAKMRRGASYTPQLISAAAKSLWDTITTTPSKRFFFRFLRRQLILLRAGHVSGPHRRDSDTTSSLRRRVENSKPRQPYALP